jgi:hypothetical protein
VGRVGIVEEQLELALLELAIERLEVGADLGGQLLVLLGKLAQLDQVARPPLELQRPVDLVAQLGGFAGEPAGALGVVPDPGGGELALELG